MATSFHLALMLNISKGDIGEAVRALNKSFGEVQN